MARRSLILLTIVTVIVIGVTGCLPPPPPPDPTLPTRMAAVGDSITTATDVAWCCVNPDGANPQYSWSTGSDPAVNSHYQRIRAINGGSSIATLNAAEPGADSADLDAQLSQAADFGAQYVTVLIGGNDLCSGPTPTAVFRQRVQSAFDSFFARAPNSRLFVASIPNLYLLWQIEHTDFWARLIWSIFDVCPNMLGASLTDAQRLTLLGLEQQFNAILADACADHPNCRWDGNAVFNHSFTTADVSDVDHYHPSIEGQNTLAALTWAASYWGS